jgi:Gpi18-like mannosyltransferase
MKINSSKDIYRQVYTQTTQVLRQVVSKYQWWLEDIGAPFLITRLALIVVGWASTIIPLTDPMPPRGWHFSPHRLLDIWGRWDTGWYISIIRNGYNTHINQYGQGNTAFFPLYPYLVKLLHNGLMPESLRTSGTILFVGVLISNVAFLGALTLLYLLIREKWDAGDIARKTVLYLCIFPISFTFSAFYTESLFLFLTIAAFYAAERGHWGLSGVAGALATLTRATGILCVIPLGILYWRRKKTITWDALFLGLIPLFLLAFALQLYAVTGDAWELFNSHAGWNHEIASPWQALFSLAYNPIRTLDQIAFILFAILALISLKQGPSYGIWAIMNTILILSIKGNPQNMMRYASVAFPTFVVLGMWGERHPQLHRAVVILFTTLLGLIMALWSQYYKVI